MIQYAVVINSDKARNYLVAETNVIDIAMGDLYKLKSLEDMKGVWTDISFCLDFKNKRMDAWVDGIKKVEILKSPVFFKPEAIYFKHCLISTKHW